MASIEQQQQQQLQQQHQHQQIPPTTTVRPSTFTTATATMTGTPPQGSNAAPNNQTPGHPSFRRFVASFLSSVCLD
jgi:hypothetical protein